VEWNSTCFGQFLCPSSGVFHCTHSNIICHTGLLTAWQRAGSGQNCSSTLILLAVKLSANLYDIYHYCVYSEKLLMMDRGTARSMKSFFAKNKFEKLVLLVGCNVRTFLVILQLKNLLWLWLCQGKSSPTDCHLFLALKQSFTGHGFRGNCEVETVVTRWLRKQDMCFHKQEIGKLVLWYNKCFNFAGE